VDLVAGEILVVLCCPGVEDEVFCLGIDDDDEEDAELIWHNLKRASNSSLEILLSLLTSINGKAPAEEGIEKLQHGKYFGQSSGFHVPRLKFAVFVPTTACQAWLLSRYESFEGTHSGSMASARRSKTQT